MYLRSVILRTGAHATSPVFLTPPRPPQPPPAAVQHKGVQSAVNIPYSVGSIQRSVILEHPPLRSHSTEPEVPESGVSSHFEFLQVHYNDGSGTKEQAPEKRGAFRGRN